MNSLSRAQTFTVLLVALVLLSVYAWSYYSQRVTARQSSQLPTKHVFVQVAGEVRRPGVYVFEKPVTVGQAVARAGGILLPLRPAEYREWTRKPTGNNSRIHIMADPSGSAHLRLGRMTVPVRLALGVPLDINQASVADLSEVPSIHYKMAEEIVALRVRRGGFSKLENLCEVRGIGPATVNRLRPYLTVDKGG